MGGEVKSQTLGQLLQETSRFVVLELDDTAAVDVTQVVMVAAVAGFVA